MAGEERGEDEKGGTEKCIYNTCYEECVHVSLFMMYSAACTLVINVYTSETVQMLPLDQGRESGRLADPAMRGDVELGWLHCHSCKKNAR